MSPEVVCYVLESGLPPSLTSLDLVDSNIDDNLDHRLDDAIDHSFDQPPDHRSHVPGQDPISALAPPRLKRKPDARV